MQPARIAVLLLSCLFTPAPATAGAEVRSVLLAEDGAGAEVRFEVDRGVVLEGFPGVDGERVLPGATAPRFAPGGALWFDVSRDDGHYETARETWVLERGALRPRPRAPGEVAPPAPGGRAAVRGSGPIRVCVDPGHGGSAPGAVGFGVREADMNLDIALHLRDYLIADTDDLSGGLAWEVLMTRTTDTDVSLSQRTTAANAWGAGRFVSIHCNAWSSPSANGTSTFSYQDGTISASLRDSIQSWMVSTWGLNDRGSHTAGFYVLVNTNMPASLSETGFITSPIDFQLISDPLERQRIALAHLHALQAHYGAAPHVPNLGAPFLYCTPKLSSLGCLPTVGFFGMPTLTGADDFRIYGTGVNGSEFGIFFWGRDQASTPFMGGTLCVTQPITRTPVQFSGGVPGTCSGMFFFSFSQAYIWSQLLTPGIHVFGQFWFRDPGWPAPNGVGLTGAVGFVVLP